MIDGVITSQSGARQFDGTDITKYSLFVGGVNATNHALRQYSPLVPRQYRRMGRFGQIK